MKNLKVLVVVLLAMAVAASCSSGSSEAVDARPAADLAVIHDTAPDMPYFNPTPGKYVVRFDRVGDSGIFDACASPLNPLGCFGFEVMFFNDKYEILYFGERMDATYGQFSFAYSYSGKIGVNAQTCITPNGTEFAGSFVSRTEARGQFISYQDCRISNSGDFTATLVPEIADAAVETVDTAPIDVPVMHPALGHYTARLVPDGSDASTNSILPLDRIGLTVYADAATGKATIFFFAAIDTDGKIPLDNGKFDFKHGRDEGALKQASDDWTVCPGNGYHITGSFVSPTEISGSFASINNCRGKNGGIYIATLDPVPDSGVASDLATVFEAGATIDAGAIDH